MKNDSPIERFRKLIIENDDLQNDLKADAPIKGDIYFDGIEVEKFLEKELSLARTEGERVGREKLKYEILDMIERDYIRNTTDDSFFDFLFHLKRRIFALEAARLPEVTT